MFNFTLLILQKEDNVHYSVEDSFWILWNAHLTDKLITINDNDHLVGEKFLATQRLTWHSPAQESVTVALQRLAPVIFQSSAGVRFL